MNQRELMIHRNTVARLFEQNDKIHRNCIRFDSASGDEHRELVIRECLKLIKEGKEFICKATIDTRKLTERLTADIVVLDDEKVKEIAVSEDDKSLYRKSKIYENYGLEMEAIR